MKERDIGTLRNVLPDVFDLAGFEGDVGDEWIAIGDVNATDADLAPLERAIAEDDSSIVPLGVALESDGSARWDGQDWAPDVPLPAIIGSKGGFPGAPGRGKGGYPPPPDALAFYLPFHHFSPKVWGIYLIAEGVDSLATDLVRLSRGRLLRRDAVVAARAFLFHHEAYHSAVEAFATRMEVAHREPFYIGGLRTLFERDQFEEALATGYALRCVDSRVLKGGVRKTAVSALKRYVQACPPPYNIGNSLIAKKALQPRENDLLEQALRISAPRTQPAPDAVWSTASYLMMPALRRKGRFTYLVHRDSSLATRTKLAVRYFDRRKLLERLRQEIGGREVGGGRHPKWEAEGGKRVPIPVGKDVDVGTVGAILAQFGISERPLDFMASRR